MPIRPIIAICAGALLTAGMAFVGAQVGAQALQARLEDRSRAAIADVGDSSVTARFTTPRGWTTRHALLDGGQRLDEATRAKIARAVGAVPGVGGVRWSDGRIRAENQALALTPLHCQDDVEALLRARTIRFEEASSRIDAPSRALLGEVATALRPCLGSIIAITGHTDSSGTEPGNLALSRERAEAVKAALMDRGIPSDGLRASGVGSREPVEGLQPEDPANRRIEFSVIATEALQPTPVDTPGAR